MKSISLLAITFLLCFSVRAQIVSTESFDNTTFVPAGWALKPALAANANAWVRITNGTNPTATPHSGAGFARFRSSSTQIANGTQQILVSRPIDYSVRGTAAANLSFWMYRDNISTTYDTIRVFVSNSDTIDASSVYLGTIARNRTYMMPDTQATTGWYQYTFSIPTTFTNNTTTRFLWQGTSEYTTAQSANMFVDDISFDEFPNQCSGTPNVGTIVKQFPVICGGAGSTSLSLTNPITGVVGLTYTWETSSSASGPWTSFGSNAPTATTPSLSATTYIRCMVYCAPSSSTYITPVDSVIVSSNPVPTVIVTPSPAVFCAGTGGVTIVATGANTYTWSPALGLDTTVGSTVVASPSLSTVYTVLGTDSAGCADTAQVNVVLLNPPTLTMTATPNDSVCGGTTVILNCVNGNTQGLTYLWSDGKTTRRDTLVVNNTTTLSVTVTNQGGCSSTDSITVHALPAQNSGFSYTVNGNTFTFTDTTIGGTNWVWDFGDGNGSTNQNPVYTYSQTGNYTVTLIVTGPCKTDTVSIPVAVYPLGVNDLSQGKGIQCYPNPTSQDLVLQADKNIQRIDIYNLYGEKVMSSMMASEVKKTVISVKNLSNGLYSLRAVLEDGSATSSFIKN